ncbi:MAG: cytochrome b/b6 domain-containing protein [Gallionella sp.]
MIQYSKRMVIIHWLTLALLIAAWYLGDSLGEATDDSKATLAGYIFHISAGGTILLLSLFRFYFRRKDGTPPLVVDTPMYQVLARWVHYLLYAALVLLPLSGITILLTSKAGPALLAGDANLLPKEHGYRGVLAHVVHEQLVTVLIVLVVVHILAAIKHQFIMKDGLMSRMVFPKKD